MLPKLPDLERLLRRAHSGNSGNARLGRRQVYILPTARGWLFGLLLVALLFTGINYSNNLILALTSACIPTSNKMTWLAASWLSSSSTTAPYAPASAAASARAPTSRSGWRRAASTHAI